MGTLFEIRDTLNEFASALHLEEEELPSVFDAELLEHAVRLEEIAASSFSIDVAKRCLALRLSSKVLVDDPAPDAMAMVLSEFQGLVVGMNRELKGRPAAAEWHLARQFNEVSEHLASPKPAENQGFVQLPKILSETAWVQAQFGRLGAQAGVTLSRTPVVRGFGKTAAKRWLRRAARTEEGQLSAAIEHLQSGIEYRSRQVWYLRRTEGEDRSTASLYACALGDVFPDFHATLREQALHLEVAKLKGLALGLQIPEFALCLESADWIAQYALNYLLPPAPSDWPVRQREQLDHLLRCRIARWYFHSFEHELEPLEMLGSVLRIGRPLFYERVAAHALLEYSLLQGIAFTRASAPFYVEALSLLEREFSVLFDGYLLRLLHYPRLKTPEGWRNYLQALYSLHYARESNDELEAFRHVFLARRGLRSTMEILYRTTAHHSALN